MNSLLASQLDRILVWMPYFNTPLASRGPIIKPCTSHCWISWFPTKAEAALNLCGSVPYHPPFCSLRWRAMLFSTCPRVLELKSVQSTLAKYRGDCLYLCFSATWHLQLATWPSPISELCVSAMHLASWQALLDLARLAECAVDFRSKSWREFRNSDPDVQLGFLTKQVPGGEEEDYKAINWDRGQEAPQAWPRQVHNSQRLLTP